MNTMWVVFVCGVYLGGVLGIMLMAACVLAGLSDADKGRVVSRDMAPAVFHENLPPDERLEG